jgi:hypothetical protein
MEVDRLGIFLASIPLAHYADEHVLLQISEELLGAFAADRQRQERVGEQHRVPYRQNAHLGDVEDLDLFADSSQVSP